MIRSIDESRRQNRLIARTRRIKSHSEHDGLQDRTPGCSGPYNGLLSNRLVRMNQEKARGDRDLLARRGR